MERLIHGTIDKKKVANITRHHGNVVQHLA
jgi:hypothetical protein